MHRPVQLCRPSSGLPRLLLFRFCRPASVGWPASASLGASGDVASGCPAAYVLLSCPGDLSFELPRTSHPSASLRLDLQVAPNLLVLHSAWDEFPGCPESCIHRIASGGSPGHPGSSLLWLRCRVKPRVASNLAPFSGAEGESPGYPGSPLLRRCRRCVFGSPRVLHLRRVDDESPAVLELCILGLRRG